jgi:DNA polymerase-3 subunit gamma/tau
MYVVFARKYRPQSFEDVVGQQHVARTLQNAVRNDRVAHAYLFCGSRGVGKTTMARILAKALNCKDGPTPDPCGECDSCRRISTGDDVDVLEIDGASNNSVDEVRELRQNVRLAPAHSRFKIYYIDEVHMLSNSAFNALLKTLEEPPSHVKFIFSTTDPQKMPETVKSRCQRFDFRRIRDADIIAWLSDICEKEGLDVPEEGLAAVARSARGGMRDALGALDQLAAYGDEHTLDDVLLVLGAVDGRLLGQVVDALAEEDVAGALRLVNESLTGGTDLEDFCDQLCQYLRDVLVAGYCGADDPMLAGATADGEMLAEQARRFTADQITYMIQVLREAKQRARRDTTGRIALELAIIKLARIGDLVPLEQLAEAAAAPRADNSASGRGASRGSGKASRGSGRSSGGASASGGGGGAGSRISSIRERLKNGGRKNRKGPQASGGGPSGGPSGTATAARPATKDVKKNANPRAQRTDAGPQAAPEAGPRVREAGPARADGKTPDGLDEMTYRQIVNTADDPLKAREALEQAPLRRAFLEARQALGIEPVKMQFVQPEEDEAALEADEDMDEMEDLD